MRCVRAPLPLSDDAAPLMPYAFTKCTRVMLLQVQSLRAGVPADPATLASGSKCDAVCDRTSFAAVCRVGDTAGRYSADGYFYKATVLKALYPGDLEYDVPYQTYAEKAG